MRQTTHILFSAILTLMLVLSSVGARAYNLRHITSQDGLSSGAVRYVTMDSDGFMWLGTYDGLNRFDGLSVKTFMPSPEANSIPGNIIRHITEMGAGKLWLRTNLGLCLFDTKAGTFDNHPDLQQVFCQGRSNAGDFFIVTRDDSVAMYNILDGQFHQAYMPGVRARATMCICVDSDNVLWVFDSLGPIMRYKLTIAEGRITDSYRLMNYDHNVGVRSAYEKGSRVVFVDLMSDLYTLDTETGKKEFVINIAAEIPPGESMRDAVIVGDDIFFAFTNDGLKVIRRDPASGRPPTIEKIDINCGIFCLDYDPVQKVVMIATDGYGMYIYSEDEYSIRSTMLHELYPQTKSPARGVMLDRRGNLWVGTKGDGILCLPDYDQAASLSGGRVKQFHIGNSSLVNNMVYGFADSRHDRLWILSDGPGLNYYSYADGQIHTLDGPQGVTDLQLVRSAVEMDDGVLWVVTAGDGLCRVEPSSGEVEYFRFFEGENSFYSVAPESDSVLWIGSRGSGVMRFNTLTRQVERFSLASEGNLLADDVLSVLYDAERSTLWCGTSAGLCRARRTREGGLEYEILDAATGLQGSTVHGVVRDSRSALWLSTNNGLTRFDPHTGHFTNHIDDIRVREFSDNAFFADPAGEVLLFGGTDGIVSIFPGKEQQAPAFAPKFYFNSLEIYGHEVTIANYVKHEKGMDVIELSHRDNYFAISFVAPDYIRGPNYTWQYKLSGGNGQWINNGKSNRVTFTNMPPGEYDIQVRFSADNIFEGRPVYTQRVRIHPPWYMTTMACLVWAAIVAAAALMVVRFLTRRSDEREQRKFEKMELQKKEEIYESKLRFFTNITHEFCTPLTLIYGPCERILDSSEATGSVHEYASVIRRNAERLNGLIQELMEFRRIDTGNMQVTIQSVAMEEVTVGILSSFAPVAEQKQIRYEIRIEPSLVWNTDVRCYTKIVTNLVSNAFKYTPDGGTIEVAIERHNELLSIRISNSGPGISSKDLPFVFNRYRVLDNLESKQNSRLFSRNGLGLFICHGTVKLLGGDIHVSSVPGDMTRFSVNLPMLEIDRSEVRNKAPEPSVGEVSLPSTEASVVAIPSEEFVKSRPTILVVDDEHLVVCVRNPARQLQRDPAGRD